MVLTWDPKKVGWATSLLLSILNKGSQIKRSSPRGFCHQSGRLGALREKFTNADFEKVDFLKKDLRLQNELQNISRNKSGPRLHKS